MTVESKKTNIEWIHAIIFFVLTIGVGFLPPFGQITEYGMDILGIFVGLIYGWTFIGFIWPSIFGLVALGYTSYATNALTATVAGFSESLVWQVFFMMIFAEILRLTGVTEYLGYWILSRKICIGRPWVIVFLLFTAAFVCGGIVSMYGTLFMLWGIVYELFNIAGYEKRNMRCAYVLGGILFMVAVSCMIFPFKPYPGVVLGLCANAGATAVPFVPWLVLGLVTAFVMIALYMIMGKFVFKVDLSAFANMGDVFAEHRSKKMTEDTTLGMVILAVFVGVLVIIGIAPAKIPIVAFLKRLDMVGLALLSICVAVFWRRKDGSKLLQFPDLAKAVTWDIIIMFVVTLPVCGAIGSADTGIMATVMAALTPVLKSLSPVAFVAVSIILLGTVTQVAHNLVLTMTFTPLLAMVAANMGIDPLLYGFMLVTMLQAATATPAASAQAALVFANTEWIVAKDAYKCGIAFAIISMVVLICIAYPLGSLMF